jgi:hypothetical protein
VIVAGQADREIDFTVPSGSNLNFSTNETIANSVLAPMTDGEQDFYNGDPRPIQLIADFFGYFAQPVSATAPPTSAAAANALQAQTGSAAGSLPAPAIGLTSRAAALALR